MKQHYSEQAADQTKTTSESKNEFGQHLKVDNFQLFENENQNEFNPFDDNNQSNPCVLGVSNMNNNKFPTATGFGNVKSGFSSSQNAFGENHFDNNVFGQPTADFGSQSFGGEF